jgi:hypothetical protein
MSKDLDDQVKRTVHQRSQMELEAGALVSALDGHVARRAHLTAATRSLANETFRVIEGWRGAGLLDAGDRGVVDGAPEWTEKYQLYRVATANLGNAREMAAFYCKGNYPEVCAKYRRDEANAELEVVQRGLDLIHALITPEGLAI